MGILDAYISLSGVVMVGFNGNETLTLDQISLMVSISPYNLLTDFVFTNILSPINAIMGCPWLHKLSTYLSTYHQVLWHPTPHWTWEIMGNHGQSWKAKIISTARVHWRSTNRQESTIPPKRQPDDTNQKTTQRLNTLTCGPSRSSKCCFAAVKHDAEHYWPSVSFGQASCCAAAQGA